jgi:hypothetical protein
MLKHTLLSVLFYVLTSVLKITAVRRIIKSSVSVIARYLFSSREGAARVAQYDG